MFKEKLDKATIELIKTRYDEIVYPERHLAVDDEVLRSMRETWLNVAESHREQLEEEWGRWLIEHRIGVIETLLRGESPDLDEDKALVDWVINAYDGLILANAYDGLIPAHREDVIIADAIESWLTLARKAIKRAGTPDELNLMHKLIIRMQDIREEQIKEHKQQEQDKQQLEDKWNEEYQNYGAFS